MAWPSSGIPPMRVNWLGSSIASLSCCRVVSTKNLLGTTLPSIALCAPPSSTPCLRREARMPVSRTSRFQLGDNWPVLVFAGLLVVLIGLKGRFTGFDAHSLSVNAMPLTLIALGQFLVVLTRGVDLSL